jgi:hypothetical protein
MTSNQKAIIEWVRYYANQRRGDIVQFGRQHVKDSAIHFMQQKNRGRSPHRMIIPIVAQLKEVIAKTQTAI